MKKNLWSFALIFLLLAGCTTRDKTETEPVPESAVTEPVSQSAETVERLDEALSDGSDLGDSSGDAPMESVTLPPELPLVDPGFDIETPEL